MNLVNARREFFYATPTEVRELLESLGDDHVLEFTETAEAAEWRASDPNRRGPSAPAPGTATAGPSTRPSAKSPYPSPVRHHSRSLQR